RRDPMLDEDLEAVAAVAEHDDADGGSDRNRLGVGDTAAPAGAVGQVRTIAALGVDVSDHARWLRSRSGLLSLSPSMPTSVRTSDGGVVPITSALPVETVLAEVRQGRKNDDVRGQRAWRWVCARPGRIRWNAMKSST